MVRTSSPPPPPGRSPIPHSTKPLPPGRSPIPHPTKRDVPRLSFPLCACRDTLPQRLLFAARCLPHSPPLSLPRRSLRSCSGPRSHVRCCRTTVNLAAHDRSLRRCVGSRAAHETEREEREERRRCVWLLAARRSPLAAGHSPLAPRLGDLTLPDNSQRNALAISLRRS